MRQLPEDASMVDMLPNGKIDSPSITALGKVLSKFYRNAKTGTDIDAMGSWDAVWKNCEENFTQMEPFAGNLFDTRIYKIIRAANRSFMRRRKPLFYKRIESGNIRDCHGDLRTEHIYFTDDGIQIIDCIEFKDRFRYSDITSDLAFLTMDLDFLGFPETVRLAENMDANIIFVECTAPDATLKARLKSRGSEDPVSDARLKHF
jgi:aminoglycoside phosphotransferase family enzyme